MTLIMFRRSVFAFLLVFLSATLSTQAQKKYQSEWKIIDSLIYKRNLPATALKEVNRIYVTAKKESDNVQLIKSLLYIMYIQERTQDTGEIKNIRLLEKEIRSSAEPFKSILNSIVAEKYLSYYQQHRWQLYNRSKTNNFLKTDIATWSPDDFHKRIGELYSQSIQNEKLLQQTKLEPLDPIILKGNVRYLRPTLFDLLTHRALDYFKNDEIDIKKPAYAFEIDQPEAFSDAKTFVTTTFKTNDSLSVHHKALEIFQRLLNFHLNDTKTVALVNVDIERILFVNNYGVMQTKDSLYEHALQQITNNYPDEKEVAEAWYLLAEIHDSRARTYDALKDSTNQYEFLVAKKLSEKGIVYKDSSEGKSHCELLLKEILQKNLSLETEEVNVPDQPFRLFINYKNIGQLFFRVIKVDKTISAIKFEYQKDDFWKKILNVSPLKLFSQRLPVTNDYQHHSVEIKIDALPYGEYALLASDNPQFSPTSYPLSVQYFAVSNLAFIRTGPDYFVLNRETGSPIENVNILASLRYDYNNDSLIHLKTNSKGFFRIPLAGKVQFSEILELDYGSDHLRPNKYNISYTTLATNEEQVSREEFEVKWRKLFLFTDRSIYRPGQTVYFKGIEVTKDFKTQNYKIIPNHTTRVILSDEDGEEIDSLIVKTNDYGSYSGKFRLPENLLNGSFSIHGENNNGSIDFSVEEYKRPKFFIEFAKQKGSYRLNDTVSVVGSVKAFSGSNVNSASVKYRVVRQTRFHIWGPFNAADQEISQGEITTDENGKFLLRFTAMPDKKVRKQDNPIFNYRIETDVRDINGETHSAETNIQVSYNALELKIPIIIEKMEADSFKKIPVATTNLAGEFEEAKVNISIYKLDVPNRLIRERLWQEPDQHIMSKEEYLKYFPIDEYSNETKKESWNRLEKVFEKSGVTKEDFKFDITQKLAPAWYLIEANAVDKYGEPVKDIRFIELTDRTGQPVIPTYSWFETSWLKYKLGDSAIARVGTSAENVSVIRTIDINETKDHSYDFFNLNKEQKKFLLPVIGHVSYGVHFAFVKNNRFYTSSSIISVKEEELKITYETYRDKTLPGAEEKWKIKVSGDNNEKVMAEMMTSIYDGSLDQFKPHQWEIPALWSNYYIHRLWNSENNFDAARSYEKYQIGEIRNFFYIYDRLAFVHLNFDVNRFGYRLEGKVAGLQISDSQLDKVVVKDDGASKEMPPPPPPPPSNKSIENQAPVTIRKNFNETAFFFPDLHTDAEGNIEFSFTMPEALTQWKWMSLAHTKDLAFGYGEKTIVTQKQLMVQPNLPRFLREGDRIELSTKIANLSDSEVTGQVELQLLDATTNEPVDGWFQNVYPHQFFTAAARQSTATQFSIQVPYQFTKPIIVRIVAQSGNVSDGEENTLPVLTNQVLVTETLPLNIRGSGTKHFNFDKLIQTGKGQTVSETLHHHSLTVEFTSNPSWYAVQSLPYLMEFPHECAEQTWNRFYANALASSIVNKAPRIKQIFEKWKSDTAALLSNLQKNQELKSVLIQETPWVVEAKSETEQKKRIGLLFDLVKMTVELEKNFSQLQQMQMSDGGFSWFSGGSSDRYITQYILSAIGHLKILNAVPSNQIEKIKPVVNKALSYLDNKLKDEYSELQKSKTDLTKNHLDELIIQYLYMRSFFNDVNIPANILSAYNYYRKQAKQYWIPESRFLQGMIALALYRMGDQKSAGEIIQSLKENAIVNEELGMYWKDFSEHYYWQQAPIETQSLLIEAFSTITNDQVAVNNMKTWLLKNKQTNSWRTTKATAEACYALLLQGNDWLNNAPTIELKLGDKVVKSTEKAEAGTGYFKKIYDASEISSNMGHISVTVDQPVNGKNNQVDNATAWGAVYWQYFENADKITSAATPLKISRKLFVERNTDRGPVLEPIEENGTIKTGDKIKVRIELRSDRDLEYVHMKDMRASSLEPIDVLSDYKYQGGLGYYQSTKDASTNFFFDHLRKGTYVFEYALFATQAGEFSNGITTIQCMYAPEYTAHSEGLRINVEQR